MSGRHALHTGPKPHEVDSVHGSGLLRGLELPHTEQLQLCSIFEIQLLRFPIWNRWGRRCMAGSRLPS